MCKTRVDLPPDILDAWIVLWFHAGPYGIYQASSHELYWGQVRDQPIGASGAFYASDATAARLMMLNLAALPDIVQDACRDCTGRFFSNINPRWNIYRGQEPTLIIPSLPLGPF